MKTESKTKWEAARKAACKEFYNKKGKIKRGKSTDYFLAAYHFDNSDAGAALLRDVRIENCENEKETNGAQVVSRFTTISDIGSFLINGMLFPNHYGDGVNSVEIIETKGFLFSDKSEIYGHTPHPTSVQFVHPQPVTIMLTDCEPAEPTPENSIIIGNCIGFKVLTQKLKIFVKKD